MNAPSRWSLLLYPRLREWPADARPAALARARDTAFLPLEVAGLAAGVAFAAWLLGAESTPWVPDSPLMAWLARYLLALPLLGLVVGPLYVQRTRRGLARELARGRPQAAGAEPFSDRKEA